MQELLRLFNHTIINATSDKELSDKIFKVFGSGITYQPSTEVLDDIITSGNLNLIQNNQLRQHLASFKSSLDFLNIQQSFTFSDMGKMLQFLQKNGSIRNTITRNGQMNFDYQSISSKTTIDPCLSQLNLKIIFSATY